MESHQRNDKRTLKQIEIPVNRQNSEDNRLNECRDLVRDLGKKTEILYRECRYDRDKASQIRAMASTLAALTVIVNRIDMNFRNTIPEILKDTRGFTYR